MFANISKFNFCKKRVFLYLITIKSKSQLSQKVAETSKILKGKIVYIKSTVKCNTLYFKFSNMKMTKKNKSILHDEQFLYVCTSIHRCR